MSSNVTPARLRNQTICSAAHTVVRGLDPTMTKWGEIRAFASGDLGIHLSHMDGAILLDVSFGKFGKVAAFRLNKDCTKAELVTIKAKTIPMWWPILEFEANAAVQAGR